MKRIPRVLPLFAVFTIALFAVFAFPGSPKALAGSDSWNVDAPGNWATGTNWLGGAAPGSLSGNTTNTDTATFGFTLTANRVVTVDAGRNIQNITFSNATSAFGYTLSGGKIALTSGGSILSSSSPGTTHTDTVASAVEIQGNGGSATFANNSTNAILTISGSVTGVSTSGNTTTLTLSGSNTAGQKAQVTGNISDGVSGGKLAIVKDGAGQWRLAGTNSFSGGVTMNAGNLGLNSALNTVLGSGTFTINGGQISQINASLTGSYANAIVVGGNFILSNNQVVNMSFAGNVDLGGSTRTITVWGQSADTHKITLAGVISGGGGLAVASTSTVGFGVLTLSGNNSFTGDLSVGRNATVSVNTIANSGSNSTLGAGSLIKLGDTLGQGTILYTGIGSTTNRTVDLAGTTFGGTLTNNGTGALVFTSGFTATGSGNKTLTLSGNNTGTNEIQGAIVNNSGTNKTALTKAGTGTWILSGNNSYTGTTLVTAGTLVVNGSVAGTMSVSSGATLGGTGTINGATTISGIHNPGNSPGIQTFASNLTYNSGATVNWELKDNTTVNAPNPSAIFDTIVVQGNLDFAGATTLNLSFVPDSSAVLWANSFWSTSKTGTNGWLLYDVTGTLTNFGSLALASTNWLDIGGNAFNTSRPGGSFSLYQSGNDVYLNYAIPEPSTWALLSLGGIAGLLLRRRRNG